MTTHTEDTKDEDTFFEGFINFLGFTVFIVLLGILIGFAWGFGRSFTPLDPIQVCEKEGLTASWQKDPHNDQQALLVCSK